MTLLERMDRLVFATRIDRMIFMKMQPRTIRWIPLFLMAALVVGYLLMTTTVDSPGPPSVTSRFLIGLMLFYGALLAAYFVRLFGPRFLASGPRPLDERELMVKARAYSISGVVLASLAMMGCFYIASAGVLKLWQPHTPNDWIALGFGIQAASMLLPTWIASWLEPRPAADQED